MLTILIGIVSSTVSEIVTALNKKLDGTVLHGDAAFLVAFVMALLGAAVKEITAPGFTLGDLGNLHQLATTFSEIFAISQVYFMFVVAKLNLDVKADPMPLVPASAPVVPPAPTI